MEGRRKMAQELRRCAFVWLVGFALATAFACGGGATLPTGPAGNRSPAIQGVSVEPNAITPGGSAMVVVTARDPEDDRLFYTFHATHGVFAIPDSSQPGRAQYLNNGTAGTDTISVIVSDTKNATVTGTAKISVDRTTGGKPPTPKPTPTPSPNPNPNPTPTPAPRTVAPNCFCERRRELSPATKCSLHEQPCRLPCTNCSEIAWSGCASGAAAGTSSSTSCTVSSLGSVTATAVATGPGGSAQASVTSAGVNGKPTASCPADYTTTYCKVRTTGWHPSDPDGDSLSCAADIPPGSEEIAAVLQKVNCTQFVIKTCGYIHGTSGCFSVVEASSRDPWGAQSECSFKVVGTYQGGQCN